MSLAPSSEITEQADAPQELPIAPTRGDVLPERSDRILPALFISAAAFILAWLDPVYIHFESRPVETVALTALGVGVVWLGTLLRRDLIMYIGVVSLLLITTVATATQPNPLSVPVVAVWPLRVMLVLLVAWSWAFLMRPPRWLNRALLATVLPTLIVFGLWGGPAFAASFFGWNVVIPVTNFTPYWLAVDSQDNVYATDARGDLIWVFDSSGSPQGTIRAINAPKVGAPGPGILPNGLAEELNLSRASLAPRPTPAPGMPANPPILDFCGIAVDPSDNIYTIDSTDPVSPTILRFDRNGMITARLPTPPNYLSTKGCIAADADRLYLSSSYGKVYIMDKQGKVQQEVQTTYRPLGMAPDGKGKLLVTQPNIMNVIEIATGATITTTLPIPQGQLRIPYQAILVRRNGEILVANWGENQQVLRIDPNTNKIIGSIGQSGFWPGQFQALGGIAEDKEGRIYVADWQHRVIQRFTDDGKIDALWWAARAVPETANGEVEIER